MWVWFWYFYTLTSHSNFNQVSKNAEARHRRCFRFSNVKLKFSILSNGQQGATSLVPKDVWLWRSVKENDNAASGNIYLMTLWPHSLNTSLILYSLMFLFLNYYLTLTIINNKACKGYISGCDWQVWPSFIYSLCHRQIYWLEAINTFLSLAGNIGYT